MQLGKKIEVRGLRRYWWEVVDGEWVYAVRVEGVWRPSKRYVFIWESML